MMNGPKDINWVGGKQDPTPVKRHADHFLMMDRPEEFNRALEKAINMILENRAKSKRNIR
jgi:hypothetical protein